jgi:dephospho-CoA kinase
MAKTSSRRKVIGVTGEKGKGKTSFVQVLVYLLSINGYPVTVLHFADYIKQIARECFARDIGRIHGKLSKTDRELLCQIGDALRGIQADCLIGVVERKILATRGFIVVGDVRLVQEAELIHRYNGVVARMQSHRFERHENYLKQHITETEITRINADFEITNDGTFNDLMAQAKEVLNHFLPHKQWKG